MLYLSREDISKVITMKEVIASVKTAFEMVAEDSVDIPLRTKIPAPKTEGEFLFMPAYAEELDAEIGRAHV